jgi:hypothetical protein
MDAKLEHFLNNPEELKSTLEKSNPQVTKLSAKELQAQMDIFSSHSKLPEQQKKAKTLDDMSNEELSALFKSELETFRKDPNEFRNNASAQFKGLSNEEIEEKLVVMAEMNPVHLKRYLRFRKTYGDKFMKFKSGLDWISCGHGTQVLTGCIVFVCLIALTLVLYVLFLVFEHFFLPHPMFQAMSKTASSLNPFVKPVQIDLNLEDNLAFHQGL